MNEKTRFNIEMYGGQAVLITGFGLVILTDYSLILLPLVAGTIGRIMVVVGFIWTWWALMQLGGAVPRRIEQNG